MGVAQDGGGRSLVSRGGLKNPPSRANSPLVGKPCPRGPAPRGRPPDPLHSPLPRPPRGAGEGGPEARGCPGAVIPHTGGARRELDPPSFAQASWHQLPRHDTRRGSIKSPPLPSGRVGGHSAVELSTVVGVTEEIRSWQPMGASGTRLGGPLKTPPPTTSDPGVTRGRGEDGGGRASRRGRVRPPLTRRPPSPRIPLASPGQSRAAASRARAGRAKGGLVPPEPKST
jgi:hypothetical protein